MPDPVSSLPPRVPILDVQISAIDLPAAITAVAAWIQARDPHYVCVTGAHGVTLCQDEANLRAIYNRAGLVIPEDRSLIQILKLKGHKNVARVYGPDLLLAACERGLADGWRHYFYGGAPGVAEKLAETLSVRFPGLVVAGIECPPFRPATQKEDLETLRRIRAARPDVVWVGLGCPRQERWMAAHLAKLGVPVLVGVGAAFDFLSGTKKQAPGWVQRSGLEWFHRLLSEPRRLWRRYVLGYPRFVFLVLKELLFTRPS